MSKPKKEYVNNLKLKQELEKSFEQDKLTNAAVDMFLLMVEGATKKYEGRYFCPEDREDCMQAAIAHIWCSWKKFDMTQDNPFGYFAKIIFNVFSGQFKEIRSKGFTKLDYDIVNVEKNDENGNKKTSSKKIIHYKQTISIDDSLMNLI